MNPHAVAIGDIVIYHDGRDGLPVPSVVVAIAEHDGDLDLDLGDGPRAVDVKAGQGPHTWEPVDGEVWWEIVYCPGCGRRHPDFSVCPHGCPPAAA